MDVYTSMPKTTGATRRQPAEGAARKNSSIYAVFGRSWSRGRDAASH
jgi:hypothetical protein